LILRPFRDDDLEPFARLNADPETMRFFPAPLSREESDASVRRAMDRFAVAGWGFWAAELREPPIGHGGAGSASTFIGFIGLGEPSFEAHFTPCVEVGWRLAREHWGRGLAPEGARASLGFAFDALGLAEVVAFTSRLNLPSIRVMEKIGMVRDVDGDFDHPRIEPGHRLQRHVLYRARKPPVT
jgi:RimJ/RimL family protein N-acetyltransferase